MAGQRISKSAFKAKALEYFRQVELTGENLIVTDYGKPVLEIRVYHESEPVPLDILRGSLLAYEHPTEPVAVDDWESVR